MGGTPRRRQPHPLLDGLRIPIHRHNEVIERTATRIYKECEAKLGKDWWK